MSKSYKVQSGDTAAMIARKVYGDDSKAYLITQGNPGSSLSVGSSIIIPDDPEGFATGSANASASEPNEVVLSIQQKRFRFWTNVSLVQSIDSQSIVDFEAPFEPDFADHRSTFRPFTFHDVTAEIGGLRAFTGTMVTATPQFSPNGRTMQVSCYSKGGVLGDCTAPASAYPLEWNGAALPVIAKKVAGLFGIGVEFSGDAGPAFKKVRLQPGQKCMDFLADLASHRMLTIGSKPDGTLLFTREADTPGVPVASLSEGVSPVISIKPFFSPQDYYSHVTGISPVVIDDSLANIIGTTKSGGAKFTVKNTHIDTVLRPFTFNARDSDDPNVKSATETKAGRMFGNAAVYEIEVGTWRDQSGNLWEHGKYVSLLAPSAMVYSRFTFLIRSVQFDKDSSSEKATLTLIMPGSLSGKIPGVLPWDE